jgi:hypothetical protein
VYAEQTYTQNFVSNVLVIQNPEYDIKGLVRKDLTMKYYNTSNCNFILKLGYIEVKETENIWLRYLTPYTLDIKQPYVKNTEIRTEGFPRETPTIITDFYFTTDLIDSYEKYPESVVSGLTKIGGILALVRIV